MASGVVVVGRRRCGSSSVLAGAVAAVAFASLIAPAGAASGTWDGLAGDGLWERGGKGGGGGVPGSVGTTNSADVATFTGTPASVAVTVDANRNIGGITFTDSAFNGDSGHVPFTIGSTGGNALYLSNGGVTHLTSSVSYTQGGAEATSISQSVSAPLLLVGPTYTFTSDGPGNVGLVIRGPVSPLGPSATTLTLNGSQNTGVNLSPSQVLGAVSDGAGGATMGIVKDGPGSWELRGGNTYSGDTVVNGGVLRFVNQTAGVEAASPNTRLIINNGGKIRFSTSGAVSPAVEIRSGGILDSSNSGITVNYKAESGPAFYLNYSSAATTVFYTNSAPVNLTGTTPEQGGIKMTATATQTPVNFGATGTQLNLGTVLRPVDVGQTDPTNTDPNNLSAAGYDMRIRGPISGGGPSGGLLKLGPGVLRLDNTSQSWTGVLEVREGQLRVNNSGALTGNQSLKVSGGDFQINSAHTQTFSSVTMTKGILSGRSSTSTVKSNSFTFDVAAGDTATVSAVIADNTAPAAVVKNGGGTLTLTRANTNTSGAVVTGGTLTIDGSMATANMVIDTGATVNGTGTLTYNLVGDGGDIITNSGTLDISGLDLSFVVSGTQTVNEYVIAKNSGGGTVVGGAFASVINLPAGGTLDYDGTPANPNAIVLSFGPSVVPGDADGDGDVDLDDQGIWASNFTGSLTPGSGSGTFGQGDFDGDKDIDLDDQGIWASNFTGSLAPLALAAVPEPASTLVVMGGLLLVGGGRRRRR